MSVEASVFSPVPPIAEPKLRCALAELGMTVRLLDHEGQPIQVIPAGPLQGQFIVVGWPASDSATTDAVDVAIAGKSKSAIDQLGQSGKLGWCELGVRDFDYEEQWKRFPDEREEYEESVEPDELAAIKTCRTRYSLRSGLRPSQCAKLVGQLSRALKQATNGIVE